MAESNEPNSPTSQLLSGRIRGRLAGRPPARGGRVGAGLFQAELFQAQLFQAERLARRPSALRDFACGLLRGSRFVGIDFRRGGS